jgi:hypothetical protein
MLSILGWVLLVLSIIKVVTLIVTMDEEITPTPSDKGISIVLSLVHIF